MGKLVRFGVIGLGLMGREFAGAAMRWAHLTGIETKPEIIAICSSSMPSERERWFREGLGTVSQVTTDYREVLNNPKVDAIYCAVPHDLHESMYRDIIQSGKHLMAEKPFGIDLHANRAIRKTIKENPSVFVRCCSEFPFLPGMQRICGKIEEGHFGTLIEVDVGFLHSSDLNPQKPINWKRQIERNGEYGVMGDLGMHVCHVPFRSGWRPKNVRAILSNLVPERPNGVGGISRCETWDNATLLVEAQDKKGVNFPLSIKTQRIAPGEMNTWYITIRGMTCSARFSTRNSNIIEVLDYTGGNQEWRTIEIGHHPTFKSITGGIFDFGFSDVLLQMWAGFLYELEHGKPKTKYSGCVTPDETTMSHRLFTAALESQKTGGTISIT